MFYLRLRRRILFRTIIIADFSVFCPASECVDVFADLSQ